LIGEKILGLFSVFLIGIQKKAPGLMTEALMAEK